MSSRKPITINPNFDFSKNHFQGAFSIRRYDTKDKICQQHLVTHLMYLPSVSPQSDSQMKCTTFMASGTGFSYIKSTYFFSVTLCSRCDLKMFAGNIFEHYRQGFLLQAPYHLILSRSEETDSGTDVCC